MGGILTDVACIVVMQTMRWRLDSHCPPWTFRCGRVVAVAIAVVTMGGQDVDIDSAITPVRLLSNILRRSHCPIPELLLLLLDGYPMYSSMYDGWFDDSYGLEQRRDSERVCDGTTTNVLNELEVTPSSPEILLPSLIFRDCRWNETVTNSPSLLLLAA